MKPLYIDHAASSPPAPEVVEAMLPWLRELHANPHSDHLHGQRAFAAVEEAREHVAALIGAEADDVVFTSGATESNNLAMQGYLGDHAEDGAIALTAIEHKSIGAVASALCLKGAHRSIIPVDREGLIDRVQMNELLVGNGAKRRMLALGHGNNEIGTVQSLRPVVGDAHDRGWRVHLDAAQSAGRLALDICEEDLDSVSLSSHKLAGPAGIGALYLAPEIRREIRPLFHGGGQEGGLRSGSVPAFLAVGFGVAATLARERLEATRLHLRAVTDRLLAALSARGVEFELLGPRLQRLPGHLSLRLLGADAADLLQRAAPHFSASLGSACTAGQIGTSHVLRGIGLDDESARQVIRLSFGAKSTEEDAEFIAASLNLALQDQSRVGGPVHSP